MKDNEFKVVLDERRRSLNMSYKDIQRRTELGYNTVRRVFSEPMNCRIGSVIRVCTAMGCFLDFTVEQHIGDELEPDVWVESLTQKEANELHMAGHKRKPCQYDSTDE